MLCIKLPKFVPVVIFRNMVLLLSNPSPISLPVCSQQSPNRPVKTGRARTLEGKADNFSSVPDMCVLVSLFVSLEHEGRGRICNCRQRRGRRPISQLVKITPSSKSSLLSSSTRLSTSSITFSGSFSVSSFFKFRNWRIPVPAVM